MADAAAYDIPDVKRSLDGSINSDYLTGNEPPRVVENLRQRGASEETALEVEWDYTHKGQLGFYAWIDSVLTTPEGGLMDANTRSARFTGLDPDTQYNIEIAAWGDPDVYIAE